MKAFLVGDGLATSRGYSWRGVGKLFGPGPTFCICYLLRYESVPFEQLAVTNGYKRLYIASY